MKEETNGGECPIIIYIYISLLLQPVVSKFAYLLFFPAFAKSKIAHDINEHTPPQPPPPPPTTRSRKRCARARVFF
jgi:hypothetical protein